MSQLVGRPPRVFISYTGEDLAEFADEVVKVVRRLQWIPIDHRDWAPSGSPSVQECRERVVGSDILVVLVAHRYGWVPAREEGGDGTASITRLEVRWARESGKEVLPYILGEKARWPSDQIEALTRPEVLAPLKGFKDELRKSLAGLFADIPSLLEKLETALRDAAGRIAVRGTEAERAEDQAAPAGPTRRGSVPPELLPCLCDRDEQEEAVRSALSTCLDKPRRRPLVFVLHGPANEAHRAFVHRLRAETLPSILNGHGLGRQVPFLHMTRRLPSGTARAAFANGFRMLLADELQIAYPRDDGALLESMLRLGLNGIAPVVTVLATEAGREPGEPFQQLYEYWAGFSDLPPSFLIVSVVCVKYEAGPGEGLGPLRYLQWWRSTPDGDESLRKAVAASEESYGRDQRLSWYVLPELPPVRLAHLDRWRDRVRPWLGHVSSERLQTILADRESLPMEIAFDKLQQLIVQLPVR